MTALKADLTRTLAQQAAIPHLYVLMASPAQVNVNPTIGALEIGVIISSFLLGVVTIQTYIYFRQFPKDPKTTKVLVGVIWLFELGQSICAAQTLYVVTVSRYGDLTSLIHTPSSLNASILFSGFIAPLAQTYFAFRIWKLSKSPFIPCLCITLASLRLLGSVVAAVQAFKMTTIIEYELQWKWLLTCILAVGASVDVIIALTLVFNLKNQRENAFASTIKIVDKLIAWTIQTGALTSIGGVAMLILFLAMPHNFIWLCIFMFLSRLSTLVWFCEKYKTVWLSSGLDLWPREAVGVVDPRYTCTMGIILSLIKLTTGGQYFKDRGIPQKYKRVKLNLIALTKYNIKYGGIKAGSLVGTIRNG
ncbi:hypothetical protein F5876DRAFT_70477 [Lentinula aff. lateritia]|uniref:Uncharacterized protein n=1 Tax=Lentinula aff. lateritia TaxID=2804960 RepID=A0ACC1TJ25_9AGAR|nr:hypothetical protein F5876DRAFT_70477 [Lentinula aff. lateritia]